MGNQRERIIGLVKKNIVTKITYGAKLVDDKSKVEALRKELERNKTLFLNSDVDKTVAKEKEVFIKSIVEELGWSLGIVDSLFATNEATEDASSNGAIKISAEKMEAYTKLYELESSKLKKEIDSIIADDKSTGKFELLHKRLKEGRVSKGAYWGDDEVDFVLDKRGKGYTFKAIATILKRPERVVRLKYHANK